MCSHHGHTRKFLLPTENAVLSPRRCTGTMKKRAKLTMSSLALALLCCCCCLLALASGLPITSKPLDNNPDHLTWEAAWLSGDSRSAGSGGKAKKITPKSIFIAPQLNGYNGSLCPPDMKVDYNGKCIQIVNINPADIVLTKLQSLLGNGGGTPNTGGDEDYDYEYDTSGPFQVNLPLSIDLPAEPPKRVESFYDSPLIDTPTSESLKQAPTVPAYPQQTTFLAETSKRPVDQTAAESHTDISFLAFESLPNGTLSTQLELAGNNGPVVQQIVLSSTTVAPSTVTTLDTADVDASSTSATSTVASTVESSSISVDSVSTTMSTTTEELSTSTTESSTSTDSGTTYTSATFGTTTEEKPVSSDTFATTTLLTTLNDTGDAELENLKTELAEESLLFDATGQSSTTELPSTYMSDFNTEFGSYSTGSTTTEDRLRSTTSSTESSTESTTPIETTTMKVLIHTMPPTRPPIRLPASPKPIQIVTPVRTKWYSPPGATPPPFIVASYTQQERTTRATPETTTVAQRQHPTEAPLLVINDTEADKKNRDAIHRQELKDKLRETMDTNNRFVYHHLPASASSTAKLPSSTSTSADHVYVDQLKKINEIIAENKQRHQQQQQQQHMAAGGSQIRFPSASSRDEDQTAAATSTGNSNIVRFPGSVSNRVTPNSNRLPDIFPKKSPDSTTQRPPFWWLPSGWEVDQTGQKPMLLRFWSRMPLVRDQSLTTGSAASTSSNSGSTASNSGGAGRWKPSPAASAAAVVPGHTSPSSVGASRGNSKSPSENFYKEVSSQDVYKVLNMRQLKHKR